MLQRLAAIAIFASLVGTSVAQDVKLDAKQLAPGARIDLTGQWLYKPGYAVSADESPEKSDASADGYFSIPVPQILNKIWWWLDDSEDFKKDEDARLKKLGFDTDKAEDGWYRKSIEIPASRLPKDAHVWAQFDGVSMRSDVYINGIKLGHHDGMFSRFEYDLTEHLKPGRNLLAVFVSMEKIPPTTLSMGEAVTVNLTASKIRSMSKGMFGPLSPGFDNRAYDLHGIWQPVRLVVTSGAKIDDVWFRATPELKGAIVDVEAKSLGQQDTRVVVKCEFHDPKNPSNIFEFTNGGSIGAKSSVIHLSAGGAGAMKAWTPDEPNLYRLDVTLSDAEGHVLDRWSQNVGFRTFEAKDGKFYLNGKPYWLRGANQLPYGKNPTDPKLARVLIQQLHDNNIRMTRTHATPWNTAWLDAADEIGLGVSVEGIRPWGLAGKIGATPADMFEHWMMEQTDVIKHLRNHPSVLIWTVGNEMMIRDGDNIDKWKQLSEAVKQTRAADPTRPVICSSTYVRETKSYEKVIVPNKFDDGDIDDPHNYKAWYGNSPLVSDSKFEADFKKRADLKRPYFGQEFATGYPDLDTGLAVLRYTRDLMTPQAFVGVYAYPGNDPKWFLEYNRTVTKRWAEQLRFQSAEFTAGFDMFSAECWFSHSYDPDRAKPYPVVEAMKQAFSPVGLALETNRRRFYALERVATNVYLRNDDDQFRDLKDVKVSVQFVDSKSGQVLGHHDLPAISAAYNSTSKLPVELVIPDVYGRQSMNVITRAMVDGKEISRTVDPIEVFSTVSKDNAGAAAAGAFAIRAYLQKAGQPGIPALVNGKVLLVDSKVTDAEFDDVLKKVDDGATAILLSPSMKEMLKRFPNDIVDDEKVVADDYARRVKEAKEKGQEAPRKPEAKKEKDIGEFVDWTPARGTRLVQGLEPMDLRWWGRMKDDRVFVSSGSFRLKSDGKGRELFRSIPAHGYIAPEQVPWQLRTVLFEIPRGKGRVWVCSLNLEASMGADPIADLVATNIVAAAADPDSTKSLRPMPSHEEMLKGKLPN